MERRSFLDWFLTRFRLPVPHFETLFGDSSTSSEKMLHLFNKANWLMILVLKTFLSDFSKSSSWETQLMLTIVVHVDGGMTSILHIMVVYSVFPPQHFINHFTMQMLMWSNKRNGQLLLRNSLFISFFPNCLHVIGKMHRPFLSPFPSGHHIFWCNLFLSSIRVPVFTFASCTHSEDHVIIALV